MIDDGFRARDAAGAFFGAPLVFAVAFFTAVFFGVVRFFAVAFFVVVFFAVAFFAVVFFAVALFFGAAPRFFDALPLFVDFLAGFVFAAPRLGAFAAGALPRALFAVVFFLMAFAAFVCFFALILRA